MLSNKVQFILNIAILAIAFLAIHINMTNITSNNVNINHSNEKLERYAMDLRDIANDTKFLTVHLDENGKIGRTIIANVNQSLQIMEDRLDNITEMLKK